MNSISTARFEETKAGIENSKKNIANEQNKQDEERKAQQIAKLTAVESLKKMESGKRVPIPLEFINLNQNKRLETIKVDDPEFLQLVETIKEVGILQAPVITIINNDIIPLLGHRRIAAAKFLGFATIICEIKFFGEEKQNLLASLVENTARKNWDIIAVAKSILELSCNGYNITRLAELLSKDRNTIARLLKVASWPEEAQELIKNYPDKIKMKLVLNLASRHLTNEEVLESLKIAAGLVKNEQDLVQKRYTLNQKKAFDYVQAKNLTERDSNLVFEVLAHFGLIKSK